VSSPKAGLLGRVVLGFPKPLEYTNSSSSYQLCDLLVYSGKSQMWCSVRTKSFMGWLKSSSSLCSMVPLVSLTLCLLLLCFTILCVQSSSQGSLLHFVSDFLLSLPYSSRFDCLYSWLLAIWSLCLFGSSSTSVDSPSAAVLGVPCSASSWMLGKWPLVLL